MSSWTTFADIGFTIQAKDLPLLFEKAGEKLTFIQVKSLPLKIERKIKVEADNLTDLIYQFLSELLLIKDTESFLGAQFQIQIKKKSRRYHLEGTMKGGLIPNDPKLLLADVKAITYHNLAVKRVGQNWQATVVADI